MYCCSTLFLLGHAQECPSLLRLGRGWLVWLLVEALVWPLGSITVGTESARPLATKPPLGPVEFPFPLDTKQNFKSRGISPGEVSQLHPYPCMSCSHMRCAGRDSKSPDLLGVPKSWFWALSGAPRGQPSPETQHAPNPSPAELGHQTLWVLWHCTQPGPCQWCTRGCSLCLPSQIQAGRWDLVPFSTLLQASSKPKEIKKSSSPTWSESGTSPPHSPGHTSPWDDRLELSTLVFLSLKLDQKSEH